NPKSETLNRTPNYPRSVSNLKFPISDLRCRIRPISKFLLPAISATISCVCLALLSGCKVGPTYHPPTAPLTANFKEPPPAGWKEAEPQDTALRGNWWEMFGDPELNPLIEQLNVSNQNIALAGAEFRAARAAIRIAGADLFPQVTVGLTGTVSRIPSRGSISQQGFSVGTGTFYQLPVNVSYEADLWGRIRHNIEANVETTQASAGDLANVRLNMQAELANDYFQLRGLDAEQQLFETSIEAFEKALQLTRSRHRGGIASQLDVSQAQTQLETTRAQAIDVGVMRAQFEHAIAVLIGKPPAELTIARTTFSAQLPEVPVALPSELLERRPDVAAAERRAASAN